MTAERLTSYRHLCHILSPHASGEQPPDEHWPGIHAVADANFVLAELHQALGRKGWLDIVPEEMWASLDAVRELTVLRCDSLRKQVLEVTEALNAIGITPVWLKGAVMLTESDWRDNARLMSDIDVWLPEVADQRAALDALAKMEYAPNPGTYDGQWTQNHHYAPRSHPRRAATIELHRHVVRKRLGRLLGDVSAAACREVYICDAHTLARLALNERILHSLIQCTLMSVPPIETGKIRLMKVVDFLRLVQKTGNYALPASVSERIAVAPWRRPMSRFLTLVERDFGLPNPLDHDRAYCDAVDHSLATGRTPRGWRLRWLVQPPSDWRSLLVSPKVLGFKLRRRLFLMSRQGSRW